jgi:hypothetical protein
VPCRSGEVSSCEAAMRFVGSRFCGGRHPANAGRGGFAPVRGGLCGIPRRNKVPPQSRNAVIKRRKGHLVDALALRGDEGRGTLRQARGRCERSVIPGSPNGATHPPRATWGVSCAELIGAGGKPGELKHLSSRRNRHQHRRCFGNAGGGCESHHREIPSVVASERGSGQWHGFLVPELSGKASHSG